MADAKKVSSDQGREWLGAAKQGDLTLLTSLLAGNPALLHHQVRLNSMTCIHHAETTAAGDTLCVQGSGIGHSAVHWCAARGYLECLEWLLQQGADVNRLNAEDSTPLHAAAANGQQTIVQYLLDHPDVTCK